MKLQMTRVCESILATDKIANYVKLSLFKTTKVTCCKIKQTVFVKHQCPHTGHLFFFQKKLHSFLTLTLTDDHDLINKEKVSPQEIHI